MYSSSRVRNFNGVPARELVEAGFGIFALLDLQVPVVGHAWAGGDELIKDEVLFESAQAVHAAFQGNLLRRWLSPGSWRPPKGSREEVGDDREFSGDTKRRSA